MNIRNTLLFFLLVSTDRNQDTHGKDANCVNPWIMNRDENIKHVLVFCKLSPVCVCQLFVKGVVNQEEQQEMSYPAALHCVFCGAKGLFMDCLIKTTSAHIMVRHGCCCRGRCPLSPRR